MKRTGKGGDGGGKGRIDDEEGGGGGGEGTGKVTGTGRREGEVRWESGALRVTEREKLGGVMKKGEEGKIWQGNMGGRRG